MINGEHLSASQRRIRQLEAHIIDLEKTRLEFYMFMNVLINRSKDGVFTINKSELIPPDKLLPIVSEEITDFGEPHLRITFKSPIILGGE